LNTFEKITRPFFSTIKIQFTRAERKACLGEQTGKSQTNKQTLISEKKKERRGQTSTMRRTFSTREEEITPQS
jgi:hypothetical protein